METTDCLFYWIWPNCTICKASVFTSYFAFYFHIQNLPKVEVTTGTMWTQAYLELPEKSIQNKIRRHHWLWPQLVTKPARITHLENGSCHPVTFIRRSRACVALPTLTQVGNRFHPPTALYRKAFVFTHEIGASHTQLFSRRRARKKWKMAKHKKIIPKALEDGHPRRWVCVDVHAIFI